MARTKKARTTRSKPKAAERIGSMTAERLIVESRRMRIRGDSDHQWDESKTREALTLLLGMVLESCDYDREPRSMPAFVARALAATIANIEDTVAAGVH